MFRRLTCLLTGAAAATTVAAVLTVGGHAAGAATGCTAYGALPARVALDADHVSVHIRLTGSSGCVAGTADNGATAYVRGPAGTHPYNLRWSRFGGVETDDLYPSLTKLGTYTVGSGDVQLYDAKYNRVPFRWQDTSTVVRFGSRFLGTGVTGSGVRGRLVHYSADGWHPSPSRTVALERRAGSGSWQVVARVHTDASGWARVAARTSTHWQYRLVSSSTSTVWGAASPAYSPSV